MRRAYKFNGVTSLKFSFLSFFPLKISELASMNINATGIQAGTQTSVLPPRFAELKRQLVPQDEKSKEHLLQAWKEIISELRTVTEDIKREGSNVSKH